MPRFSVKQKTTVLQSGELFSYVDLIDQNGPRARIALQGCSLQEHWLPFGDDMVNVVYGHEDWVRLKRGLERRDSPTDNVSSSVAQSISKLMQQNPTWAGAATLDIANRVKDGLVAVVNTTTGEIIDRYDLGINHEASHSFLHGTAMYHEAQIMGTKDTGSATVSFYVPIGKGVSNYPAGIGAYITFELGDGGCLKEYGVIFNEGRELAPIASGRHASYRIGSEGLDQHILKMVPRAALYVD